MFFLYNTKYTVYGFFNIFDYLYFRQNQFNKFKNAYYSKKKYIKV